MLLKANWKEYLHGIRKQEMDAIFSCLGNRQFSSALEIGAGDGYQTTLLAKRCGALISTDLNFKRIKEELKVNGVIYQQCDADDLAGKFDREHFDLIFSSNLIEHLRDPAGFLGNTRNLLTPGSYGVHIVPGRLLKVSFFVLHYLNLFILALDRLVGLFQGKKLFRDSQISLENNINRSSGQRTGRFKFFFVPLIHGNFRSHREELKKFGKVEWQELFERAGFKVVFYIKGPVFSGYGFGFAKFRRFLKSLGLCSEHIFIIQKNN